MVELENVTKIYRLGEVQIKALNGINLEIKKGEFVSIMGPSGSGKSTMLHIIGCLDTPTSGKVLINGKDVSKLSDDELAEIRNKEIGFVFQFYYLQENLTSIENVELPMIFAGVNENERKRRALDLLRTVGLEKRVNSYPRQLSGGERQRVAIARALANNPSLVLADEPTGNLDSKSGEEIMTLFKRLNSLGNTIVVITHDKTIASHTPRIIKLKDGKIVGEVRK
ncbi:MAG: ABC transporter ATP-binding protein [Candidatus Parvarchaeota archaeon]|nr:ABC transporter ATP-binding protein [Candidatus Jingweiarchaeum tengchongense]MCW1299914.1 ABC transporter ATP-binding protein [Candidatus Jingweiarchaeum tengchongense]MCW1305133.1 ABC transporter ATP-binding protein [Candidatus Jingweiarchaeum tengchongense]MCW1305536.1 ABC transporter ATP-binding protein [Candidatus Jingweiarchaeum tengchongense]MCW1310354.1 ABC transporter ATP-binding protein [Candidatus Jingweiarchaeum tengchongense]